MEKLVGILVIVSVFCSIQIASAATCETQTNCVSCGQTTGCGWCQKDSENGTCLEISTTSMAQCMILKTGATWLGKACPGYDCGAHGDCGSCVGDLLCGWCGNSNACVSGYKLGPTNSSACMIQNYHYDKCPLPNNCTHGMFDSNTGECFCEAGWEDSATGQCNLRKCPQDCKNPITGILQGTCNNGTCSCFTGYTDPESGCNGMTSSCPLACSGHGTCVNNICECDPTWHSAACNLKRCGGFETVFGECYGNGFCNNGTCQCIGGFSSADDCKTAPAPEIESVKFSGDFFSINVMFKMDTNMANGESACSYFFNAATVAKLTDMATCGFDSPRNLMVVPGPAATIAPNDVLVFLSNKIFAFGSATNGLVGLSKTISTTVAAVKPVVSANVPNTVGSCNDLIIDVGESAGTTGLYGRDGIYQWSVTSGPALNLPNKPFIHIPSQNLTGFVGDIILSVTVKNYLNQVSNAKSIVIRRLDSVLPIVTIQSPKNFTHVVSQELRLTVFSSLCGAAASTRTLYKWSASGGLPIEQFGAEVIVKAGRMMPGVQYNLKVVAWTQGTPLKNSSARVTVIGKSAPLHAMIAPGFITQNYKVPFMMTIHVLDPDQTMSSVVYQWSCKTVLGLKCFNATAIFSGTEITLPTGSMLKVGPGVLAPGKYIFSGTVSKPGRPAVPAGETVVQLVGASLPHFSDPISVIGTHNFKAIRGVDLVAQAQCVSSSGSTANLKYQWYSIPAGAITFSNPTAMSQVIPTSNLKPGFKYQLRLNCTQPGVGSVQSEVPLEIWGLPKVGQISADKTVGQEMVTVFTFEAQNFKSLDSSNPITEYLWFVNGNLEMVTPSNQFKTTFAQRGKLVISVRGYSTFGETPAASVNITVSPGAGGTTGRVDRIATFAFDEINSAILAGNTQNIIDKVGTITQGLFGLKDDVLGNPAFDLKIENATQKVADGLESVIDNIVGAASQPRDFQNIMQQAALGLDALPPLALTRNAVVEKFVGVMEKAILKMGNLTTPGIPVDIKSVNSALQSIDIALSKGSGVDNGLDASVMLSGVGQIFGRNLLPGQPPKELHYGNVSVNIQRQTISNLQSSPPIQTIPALFGISSSVQLQGTGGVPTDKEGFVVAAAKQENAYGSAGLPTGLLFKVPILQVDFYVQDPYKAGTAWSGETKVSAPVKFTIQSQLGMEIGFQYAKANRWNTTAKIWIPIGPATVESGRVVFNSLQTSEYAVTEGSAPPVTGPSPTPTPTKPGDEPFPWWAILIIVVGGVLLIGAIAKWGPWGSLGKGQKEAASGRPMLFYDPSAGPGEQWVQIEMEEQNKKDKTKSKRDTGRLD